MHWNELTWLQQHGMMAQYGMTAHRLSTPHAHAIKTMSVQFSAVLLLCNSQK